MWNLLTRTMANDLTRRVAATTVFASITLAGAAVGVPQSTANFLPVFSESANQKEHSDAQEQDEQALAPEANSTGIWPEAGNASEGREAPVHLAGSRGWLESLVVLAFPEDPETALRIVNCESRWDPQARSRTGDTGLFQINDIHKYPGGVADGVDLYDPVQNVAAARRLYDQSGWHPWTCY